MGVFRLGWWSTQVRTGFHVPGPTQEPPSGPAGGCAYVALTLCRRPSHAVRLPSAGPRRERQLPGGGPCNPGGGIGWRPPARRFGHRSPFARRYSGNLEVDFFSSGYLDVSVPRVVLPQGMCSQGGCMHRCMRVRPFGDPGSSGVCPYPGIIAACRVLHRLHVPRHPPCALHILAPLARGAWRISIRSRSSGIAYRSRGRAARGAI